MNSADTAGVLVVFRLSRLLLLNILANNGHRDAALVYCPSFLVLTP